MYEGDTPNAERRAAALSLDRDLLRELLGQEELRDLIDPGALEQVEADLQHRSERTRAATCDALHDVLRRLGDLTRRRGRATASSRASTPTRCSRRSSASGARYAAHRRRGALGRRRRRRPVPRRARRRAAGRPAGGVRRGRRATARAARRPLRPHPRAVHTDELRDRYGVDPTSALQALERAGDARARRAAPRRQRARVVRRRGPAPAAPRLAGRAAQGDRGRPTSGRSPRSCRPGRASTAIRRRAPGSTGCARCSCRCRGWRCPPTSGSATCCRAASARTRRRGWTSCAPRARSSGSAPARWGATRARSRCTSATTPRPSGRRRTRASARASRPTTLLRERLAAVAVLLHRLPRRARAHARGDPGGAVGPRLGGRGDQRRVGAVARPAPDARPRPARRARATGAAPAAGSGRAAARAQAQVQGRWSLTSAMFRARARARPASPHARRAPARALRHRQPRAGPGRGRPGRLLDPLRRALPARDARHLPARLLRRGARRRAVRPARRGRAAAHRPARARTSAADRAGRDRPGAALRRRAAVAQARRRAPQAAARRRRLRRARRRRAGRSTSSAAGAASRSSSSQRPAPALRARGARRLRHGRPPRQLSLERVDGQPVVGSDWEPLLVEMGFRPGPRKLTLSA